MIENTAGKHYFGKLRFSSPSRRRELLRDEVSQGSTSPLKSTPLSFEGCEVEPWFTAEITAVDLSILNA